MKTKFTKGEWTISILNRSFHINAGVNHVASLTRIDIPDSGANAKLISAAPDLLESCIELLEYYKNEVSIPILVVLKNAQNAIKKAVGSDSF